MHIILFMSETIKELGNRWLATKPLLGPRTLMAYTGEVNRFDEFCQSQRVRKVDKLSADLWEQYVAQLRTSRTGTRSKRVETLSERSAVQAQRITAAFLRWLRESGRIDWSVARRKSDQTRDDGSKASGARRGKMPQEEMLEELPAALLGLDATDGSEEQLRAHITLNLLFWGALRPSELAILPVEGISKLRDGLTRVQLPGTTAPRYLPDHVWHSWQLYRKIREHRRQSRLRPQDPVLCSLSGVQALTSWSIWSIVKSANANLSSSPRSLRSQYLRRITLDATRALQSARVACGLPNLLPSRPDVGTRNSRAQIAESLSRTAKHL